jgi:hypothetical protein
MYFINGSQFYLAVIITNVITRSKTTKQSMQHCFIDTALIINLHCLDCRGLSPRNGGNKKTATEVAVFIYLS